MFKPLTAAPVRDLGTLTNKCPKILSPFPVGDVPMPLFLLSGASPSAPVFPGPKTQECCSFGGSPRDLSGLHTLFLTACHGRMCALATLLSLLLFPVFAQLQIMCRIICLY